MIDPVRRMDEVMQRIASGDLSQRVEVENQDELGELAAQINQMAEVLASHQGATPRQDCSCEEDIRD